ncbi:hypothetical protein GGI12_004266 [Dipsacomyces acuminosporus]|nr:hypothetical protein GGI12_004266 [Dipsacomyces acuminosporus]
MPDAESVLITLENPREIGSGFEKKVPGELAALPTMCEFDHVQWKRFINEVNVTLGMAPDRGFNYISRHFVVVCYTAGLFALGVTIHEVGVLVRTWRLVNRWNQRVFNGCGISVKLKVRLFNARGMGDSFSSVSLIAKRA